MDYQDESPAPTINVFQITPSQLRQDSPQSHDTDKLSSFTAIEGTSSLMVSTAAMSHHTSPLVQGYVKLQKHISTFYHRHKKQINIITLTILVGLYVIFLIMAIYVNFLNALELFIITLVVLCCIGFYLLYRYVLQSRLVKLNEKITEEYRKIFVIRYVSYGILCMIIVIYLAVAQYTSDDYTPTISGCGLIVFLLVGLILSHDIIGINWPTIFWGLIMEMFLGFVILRWSVGPDIFKYIIEKIMTLLNFTDAGSKVIFGDYMKHEFIFRTMPTVVFFNTIISILQYYGVIQWIFRIIGFCFFTLLGISAFESTIAVASIAFGIGQVVVILAPYLLLLTNSELLCCMTCGIATMNTSFMAVFHSYGINTAHVIAVSIMAAPASIVASKLMYPESSKVSRNLKEIIMARPYYRNILEASVDGAKIGVKIVICIASNILVSLACVQLVNNLMSWMCSLLGYKDVELEDIVAYVFYPIAVLIGVPRVDAFLVGRLLAIKLLYNQLIAYEFFGNCIQKRLFSKSKSIVLALYSVCGNQCLSQTLILVSVFSVLAPTRKLMFAKMAVRSLVTANLACFLSACIAGVLIQYEREYDILLKTTTVLALNITRYYLYNSTISSTLIN